MTTEFVAHGTTKKEALQSLPLGAAWDPGNDPKVGSHIEVEVVVSGQPYGK
jgi:hypothetical protein